MKNKPEIGTIIDLRIIPTTFPDLVDKPIKRITQRFIVTAHDDRLPDMLTMHKFNDDGTCGSAVYAHWPTLVVKDNPNA